MKITVMGAGAWGTALAIHFARHGHDVTMWARNAQHVQDLAQARENARYLPGFAFPDALQMQADLGAALQGSELVLMVTSVAGLRDSAQRLIEHNAGHLPVLTACKGFEQDSGLLTFQVVKDVLPDNPCIGVLSGPSFAQEVARNQPTALVAASEHASVREALVAAFHSPSVRVYANEDIVGVEVGGAVKNVLAIATGLCDGLALGLNARAALITRGLAEMTRLGLALGARPDTFMGLSGLGDLVLTATGDLSRNRRVGMLLAQGHTLAQAVESLGHVAEGVYCARTVAQRAQALGVDMPITRAVVALLDGRLSPPEAVATLMGRDPATEFADRG